MQQIGSQKKKPFVSCEYLLVLAINSVKLFHLSDYLDSVVQRFSTVRCYSEKIARRKSLLTLLSEIESTCRVFM